MKIGINARTFSVDEPGGSVQTSLRLTNELMTYPEIEVVLFGHNSLKHIFPNAKIIDKYYLKDSQIYGLFWERTVLPNIASAEEVDVLYCPNGNAPLHPVSYPVVMCIHDINAIKGMSNKHHQLYRKLTVPQAAKSADAVVTVSNFSKREIVNELSIDSNKINVVHNGIKNTYFNNESSSSIDLPEKYILYVGAFNPRKNIKRLVAAFKQLKEEADIPHKLVLIGPKNKMIFKNMDITISEEIITPGFLKIEELKFAYQNATIFAYPSLYEGFGLPPLEAMACKTPVVASTASSLPEILDNAAELADPYEIEDIKQSIYKVISDEQYQDKLANLGQIRSQRFTWKAAAEKMVDIFISVNNKR
ncbi:glycosyltransferase family 4 protein [Haladaptatus caseinilyticus]|uniref:glycosyltransferase family 4 protein n=1 Tax=Haladaptatus caseinilyticus TaxID=2993314 RepID=UPI00224A738E|nr:glycosyltransferase family 1 protein [Haladaptatus caseinilyticus]